MNTVSTCSNFGHGFTHRCRAEPSGARVTYRCRMRGTQVQAIRERWLSMKFRNQFVPKAMRISLAVFSLYLAGCCCCSSPSDGEQLETAEGAWGMASARVEMATDGPSAVVIDLQLLDQARHLMLHEAAFSFARRPRVVTIDRRFDLSLSEPEGFQGGTQNGNIGFLVQVYDPAILRVTDTHWTITLPLRTAEARAALVDGGKVVIDPNHDKSARSALQGLAFQW
jgi:hypothetical protein